MTMIPPLNGVLTPNTTWVTTKKTKSLDERLILPYMPELEKEDPAILSWRNPLDPNSRPQKVLGVAENLVVIGPPKSRKSFFAAMMMAGFYTKDPMVNVGFHAPRLDLHGIRFDTEMNRKEVYKRNRSFNKWVNADLETGCPYLKTYYLRSTTMDEKFKLVDEALSRNVAAGIKTSFILADQAVDFTNWTDTPEEGQNLIAFFEYINVQYNCACITVMHTNRQGKNSNGHVGSHVDKKIETQIKVSIDEANGVSSASPTLMRDGGSKWKIDFAQEGQNPILIDADANEFRYESAFTMASGGVGGLTPSDSYNPNVPNLDDDAPF